MAKLTDAQVAALEAVVIAGGCNTGPNFEQVCQFVWSHFTPVDTANAQPGFIYSQGGKGPQDINGVGAAILAQFAISGITGATGGIAPQLERIGQAALAYPYDRAVNPPSWQQPHLPAGAPGP